MPHIMIVVSPYYKEVADNLLEGAQGALDKENCTYEVYEVSGALEIPLAVKYGAIRKEGRGVDKIGFDGFVALGCVIRGETSHYDVVCKESAEGLSRVSLEYGVPVGNAILTCDTMSQAIERAKPSGKNKGADAVKAVLSLIELSIKVRR